MHSTHHRPAGNVKSRQGKQGSAEEQATPALQTAMAPVVDEAAITRFLLLSGKALRAIEEGKVKGNSTFVDRQHLLGAVAAVAVASAQGDFAKASAQTGILPNALERWIDGLESRFPLRGLKRTLHSGAAIRELSLPPDRETPESLSFGVWSAASVIFKELAIPEPEKKALVKEAAAPVPRPAPAPAASTAPAAPPAEKKTASAAHAAPKKPAAPKPPAPEKKPAAPAAGPATAATAATQTIPGTPVVEWIRGVIANSYAELERYAVLQAGVESGNVPKGAVVPSFVALKAALFWQSYAHVKGDRIKLLDRFPDSPTFVMDQIEVFGRLKGISLDRAFFKSAFEVAGAPPCRVHTTLPSAVKLDAVEAQLRKVQDAVTAAGRKK